MRIVAGTLGGRIFTAPSGHKTHPMSEKIRGALFNVLGDVSDLSVLDAFSGSGAVAFEALSRGANSALLIDHDRLAQQAIITNITALRLQGHAQLVKAAAGSWSDAHADQQFDLVICDPPYNDLQQDVLQKLTRHVKSNGVMIVSMPPEATIKLSPDLHELVSKSYGDARLTFYRKQQAR